MSTRSDAHVWKAHIDACLYDYSYEDISYISTTTSHLSARSNIPVVFLDKKHQLTQELQRRISGDRVHVYFWMTETADLEKRGTTKLG